MKLSTCSIFLCALWLGGPVRAASTSVLDLEATIPLPAVKGRIDHLTIDGARGRLFVAALGNDTIEVVDLKQRRHERSLTGFAEPQGVLYVARHDRVYVANGRGDRVDILDAASLDRAKRVDAEDADNLRLDPTGNRVIVGYGNGALRVLDAAGEAPAGDIPLAGHPESFQLEKNG